MWILIVCLVIAIVWLALQIRSLAVNGKADALTNIAVGMRLNLWDWVAVTVALLSLFVSSYNTWAQYKTMKNTATLDTKMVWSVMLGQYSKITQNSILLYAVRDALEKVDFISYPSEEILEQMKIEFLTLAQIPIMCMEGINYYRIQGMIDLVNIFNVQLSVTERHLMSKNISSSVKVGDLNQIIAMNWLLAQTLYKAMLVIYPLYAGKGKEESELTNKTASKIRNYMLTLLRSYKEDSDTIPTIDDPRLRKESRNFLSAITGDNPKETERILELFNDIISRKNDSGIVLITP